MHTDTFDRVVILDLETAPIHEADAFVEPPDLDSIKAAANLKDPEKVAADIQQRRAKAEADHAEKLTRCALDWNLARIVVLGWSEGGQEEVRLIQDEAHEASDLRWFWGHAKRATLMGFYIRSFDLPLLITRSRLLGVPHPKLDLGRYARDGRIVDLYDVLTFQDMPANPIMKRSLQTFARRYGLPVTDTLTGADVAAKIQEGDYEAVMAHCLSDLQLTKALAVKLGLLTPRNGLLDATGKGGLSSAAWALLRGGLELPGQG